MAEGNVVTRALKRIVAGYKSVPGIVVRAIVATLLGTGDLVSDLYTTVNLFSLSHLDPAYAMVAMICLSVAVQVRASSPMRCIPACVAVRGHQPPVASFVAPQALLAVVMTKHHGKLAMLKELFLVLTCLKPAVEIWRLAHGAEHDPGAPMRPEYAMMAGKIAERVLESIPAAILQTITLLAHADARSPWAVVSIVIACVATAFVATTIAFNVDSDPVVRHRQPQFHGCADSPRPPPPA
jgi:hypothetical protein